MTGQALQSASHCRRSSRVVARSSRVVGRDRVVARGKILGGRRRGVMVGREKNDFFSCPEQLNR